MLEILPNRVEKHPQFLVVERKGGEPPRMVAGPYRSRQTAERWRDLMRPKYPDRRGPVRRLPNGGELRP